MSGEAEPNEEDKRLIYLESMRCNIKISEEDIFRKTDNGTLVERRGDSAKTYLFRVSNMGFTGKCRRKKLNVCIKRIEGIVSEYVLLKLKEKDK